MTRSQPPSIPLAADEAEMVAAFLDFYRAALLDRAYGLDDEQLKQQHPPTTLTLARLLVHMAYVEAFWYVDRFGGDDVPEPWASLDWDADPDAEMALVDQYTGDEMRSMLEAACEESRRRAAAPLDQLAARPNRNGEHWSLRWIQLHMIEEYARHCGHADLIREAIDGDVAS